jgi:hypothetical protein
MRRGWCVRVAERRGVGGVRGAARACCALVRAHGGNPGRTTVTTTAIAAHAPGLPSASVISWSLSGPPPPPPPPPAAAPRRRPAPAAALAPRRWLARLPPAPAPRLGVGCLLPVACESSMGSSLSCRLEGMLDSGCCSLARPVSEKGCARRGRARQQCGWATACALSCDGREQRPHTHSPALRRLLLGGEKGVPPSVCGCCGGSRRDGNSQRRSAGIVPRHSRKQPGILPRSVGVSPLARLSHTPPLLLPPVPPHPLCAVWACPAGCSDQPCWAAAATEPLADARPSSLIKLPQLQAKCCWRCWRCTAALDNAEMW